jgi:Flp pilus assembly protein TadG
MRPNRACGAGGQSGVALVEFALVVPILLVILLGILDFGKAFNYWIDETHLASSGARLAIVDAKPGSCPGGGTASTLQEYIQCQADTKELRSGGSSTSGAEVCISFPNGTHLVGDPVQVTVSAEYSWLPLIGDKISRASADIVGQATMRLEALPTYTAGCYSP